MSKQMLVIVGVLAATFCAGIATGFFLASDPSRLNLIANNSARDPPLAFSPTRGAGPGENNTVLSSRIRELEKELADPQQKRRAALADRVAFFKKYGEQISIQPFSEGLEVTAEMKALLDLSPEEKQAVERHLAETKAELDKLQEADTVLSEQTDTSVAYDIAADTQGAALKDKLRSLLTSDIGEDRTSIFMKDSWSYNSQLSGFLQGRELSRSVGRKKTTIGITRLRKVPITAVPPREAMARCSPSI